MWTDPSEKLIPILMYHSISRDTAAKFRQFVISPALFAEHMAYLYEQSYTPLTATQFVTLRSQGAGALPKKPVVITFDDGFADFYAEALPILRRYGFPATVYVATAYINDTSRWLKREGEAARPMLSGQQLREICMQGIECGAHSHTHPQLDTIPLSSARDEIVRSKEWLEQQVEQLVTSFAYPYGYYTAAVRRLVQDAGYTSACAVKHRISQGATDPYVLTRLMVSSTTDRFAFAALIDGVRAGTTTLYMRARTPIWQLVRRSAALMKLSIKGSIEA